MAQVLAKIFQNRKFQGYSSNPNRQNKSNTRWHVARFTKENINLVLFKDSSVCGKQLILDSRCFKKLTLDDILCEKCRKLRAGRYCRKTVLGRRCPKCPGVNASISSYAAYKRTCPSERNDIKLVREMVFGTAPLASRGTTLKVHLLKNPHQLMLSNLFPYKKCKDIVQNADYDTCDSFETSMYGDGLPRRSSDNNLNSLASNAGSMPMDMPSSRDNNTWGSESSLNLSVTSSDTSWQTPLPSPGTNSVTSINSSSKLNFMRRVRHGYQRSLQYNTFSSDSPQSTESSSPHVKRRSARIGMAVIFNLDEFDDSRRDFEAFFFSHVTLIEGQLATLRTKIEESACADRVEEYILEALEEFRQKVYDLYTAPRLHNPVWLSMMASTSQKYKLCEVFVREFTILADRYDTKSTNFFISSLLTGVLMYHLAWVPTVTPSGETHSSYSEKHSAKWLDMLAKSHPYNPLWAQLSDMYGAIGMPPRQARTIVCGKKVDTVTKLLFVLSYFIRCSEIHETLDECFDEEFLVNQLTESALEQSICVESMERDANCDQEFVVVDHPNTSPFMNDVEGGSDSGLVSQYTGNSKATRPRCISGTTPPDSESGFTEPQAGIRTLADVTRFPSSSPADKVREWINTTSQMNKSSTQAFTPVAMPDTLIHRSGTNATLVNSATDSPCLSPAPANFVQCAAPPPSSRVEVIRPVGRAAVSYFLPDIAESFSPVKDLVKSTESEKTSKVNSAKMLRRLFSSEIEEFDEYFDGKPPSLSRQNSNQSTSQFDEYFDDLDSYSMFMPPPPRPEEVMSEPATPTANTRTLLNKIVKESGFPHIASANTLSTSQSTLLSQSQTQESEPPARPTLSKLTNITSQGHSGQGQGQLLSPASEEEYRPRKLSVGKQSSRCSTPQTVKNGGTTTPCSESKARLMSVCPTIISDDNDDNDEYKPFNDYCELSMPRSTAVSRLADTSISTTSFGRQQLAGFSDHYLSDFVLHGTSDDEVISKVKKDLVSSVDHSVLEDRISEAVCVVADTERWEVKVCSSMREQAKPLKASHLVINMVETVSKLFKLKMSPEFILMHMEDRLQEMFFKSRMLSEYIKSRKRVDMDELDAMFGLDVSDIRFLLSVASTHSRVNVDGIY